MTDIDPNNAMLAATRETQAKALFADRATQAARIEMRERLFAAEPNMVLTEAQERQPMKEFVGPLSGRMYFERRNGFRWEVWFTYRDGTSDPNGASEWRATSVRYWRWISAARAASDLWASFNAGVWCESGRMSCDLLGKAARS